MYNKYWESRDKANGVQTGEGFALLEETMLLIKHVKRTNYHFTKDLKVIFMQRTAPFIASKN